MSAQKPKRIGRPPIDGRERMLSRTIQVPAALWRAIELEAARARVSVASIVRARLGISDADASAASAPDPWDRRAPRI